MRQVRWPGHPKAQHFPGGWMPKGETIGVESLPGSAAVIRQDISLWVENIGGFAAESMSNF